MANIRIIFIFTIASKISGAGGIKKLLKLTMISGNFNQSEPRILYLIVI